MWQQAFYVNDTFFTKGSSAPVFLCVGGEGPPLDGSAVVRSVHCNVAVEWLQETGALMFALEHRYYGCHNAKACPVANLSEPGALRYHSSRQALGDIASFIQFANEAYGLHGNKWVTWGGSYPGMLAGWARLKFPHLVHAAVASSAPVRAELDMRGYNDVVAEAYAVEHERVGGSAACHDAIRKGHQQIGQSFGTSAGRSRLAELFGKSAGWYTDIANQQKFAGQGVADFPAQSNDPACHTPMCDIARICAAMTDASLGDEVQRLAHVRRQQDLAHPQNKSAAARAAEHSPDEDPTPGYNDGEQLWLWQTCTEFGFYQTCEIGSKCFYTQGLATLADEVSLCQKLFGISAETVQANIAYSNAYYGSDEPEGNRVMYVNGEVDPWRANSINAPLSAALPALFVPGASHHAWTHPSSASDQESVVAARRNIREQVAAFLKEPPRQEILV
uniref:Thymus-specific serine protease n=1 Tax=Zooxanthella nutricula TaxID=1333877 RepID=A0A7S2PMK7_9DINO